MCLCAVHLLCVVAVMCWSDRNVGLLCICFTWVLYVCLICKVSGQSMFKSCEVFQKTAETASNIKQV